ncbi:hypothetical protein HP567_006205 [Brevibacillus sp. M2.1A]|uniref:hypothetical protein n=1 Tax=Brevibacillus sp. M2.1A TaxID=2738980 RepID=UPI001E4C9829|nr:hypothetical protein [Brevibacillus sp. M2.1A]MCC8434141.1 hypothetical protein [Brevibacillus sp. M2.1A]
MGHTFGIFSKSVGNVTFGKMRSSLVEGAFHPNHPDNPDSPNRPRAEDRYAGYQNPLLGDPGKGQIGRWQTVNLDSLESMIDQMIEQFVRDKNWYAKVRCREALWNMYRRLEWWVNQQIDPQKNDYQRALLMVRDCIYKILKNAEQPDGTHQNVSLPVCPAPYYHHFSGYYLNHYDAIDKEVPTFDMRTLPLSDKFHGLFRYVSSTEDQEWKMVHSVGSNEMAGSENIMKLDVTTLKHGNSSKVTFQWRFKKQGFIRFKYMVSTAPGDGLLFFINNNQVGGEWNQNNSWQEAKFHVKPGQTYKFDWFVRRMSDRRFGKNAVYVKDVECVEVVQSLDEQTPPDVDTLGDAAYNIPGWEWITFSDKSIMTTYFSGINDTLSRKVQRVIDAECAGDFSFQYEMGVDNPPYTNESVLFFDEEFASRTQIGEGVRGSTAVSQHGWQWSLDGRSSSTQEDSAIISYDIEIGDNCTVDLTGDVQLICPPLEIDHYEERTTNVSDPLNFSFTGVSHWEWKSIPGLGSGIYMQDPIVSGNGDATYTLELEADGWIEFSFTTGLRDTERLLVIINDVQQLEATGDEWEKNVQLPLVKGRNTVIFRIQDDLTEEPLEETYPGEFSYRSSSGKHKTPMGSYIDVDREWRTDKNSSYTEKDRAENVYNIFLNPGSFFDFSEELELKSLVDDSEEDDYEVIFSEDFNDRDNYAREIRVDDNWEWEDIVTRYHGEGHGGDGVLKVENKDGTLNRLYVENIDLNEPGFVKFEYGGSFSDYEYLSLYSNNRLIWSENKSTSDPLGRTVLVPLGRGKQTLKWVFEDCDEIEVEDPDPDYKPPTKPDPSTGGEKCYPAGSETHLGDYSPFIDHQQVYESKRKFRVRWMQYTQGPVKIYYDGNVPIAQGTERDGYTLRRFINNSSVTSAKYSERLKIYAGKGYDVPNAFDVPVKWVFRPHPDAAKKTPIHYDNTYVITSEQVANKNNSSTFWYVIFDSVGNEHLEVEFDYQYYCYELDSQQGNKNGRQVSTKRLYSYAIATEYDPKTNSHLLVTRKSIGWNTPTITTTGNKRMNVGNKQNPYKIRDWSAAKHHAAPKFYCNKPGPYCIVFDVKRTFFKDSTLGKDEVPYYIAIRNLKLTSNKHREFSNNYDDTKVEVTVTDITNRTIIDSYPLSAGPTGQAEHFIKYDVPQGRHYRIDYKLLKGISHRGGLDDNGGVFTLSQGKAEEKWGRYCIDKLGSIYPKDNSPYEPNLPPPTQVIIPDDSWCWIDTIEIRQSKKSKPCRDAYVRVRVYDEDNGTIISEEKYTDFDDVQTIKAAITNDSDEGKNYSIRIKFYTDCDAEARLSNGEYTFHDKLPLPKSSAFVYNFKTTANVPIWMGGCNGSNIQVNIYDQTGNKLQNTTVNLSGNYDFTLENLSKPSVSKVRVEITTEQKGEISEWTGKSYLTTFKLRNFKATENWTIVPSPFNSQLDFFIDGVLRGSYTNAGGAPVFQVDRGRHTFTWVFTAKGTTEVWDYCNIDYIKLTNWICDKVLVTPYCDPGSGDKCVEALIKCLLAIWKQRPEACVIGKRIWLFT